MGTLNSIYRDNTCSILILPNRPISQLALDNKLLSVDLHLWGQTTEKAGAPGRKEKFTQPSTGSRRKVALWRSNICWVLTATQALGGRWGNQGTERRGSLPLNWAGILSQSWNVKSGRLTREQLLFTPRSQTHEIAMTRVHISRSAASLLLFLEKLTELTGQTMSTRKEEKWRGTKINQVFQQ